MLVVLTQKPGSEKALLAGFFTTLVPHPSNFSEKLSHGAYQLTDFVTACCL
jgi:hypothetical protein